MTISSLSKDLWASLPRSYTPTFSNPFSSFQNISQKAIGNYIRDTFFLPLMRKNLPPNTDELLKKELDFVQNFWDKTKPVHPHLPMNKEIRNLFTQDKKTFSLDVEGKPLKVETAFFHLKNPFSKKAPVTMVYFLGNLSYCDRSVIDVYPFLTSYIEEKRKNPSIAPLQIFTIGQYETSFKGSLYKPQNLEEIGKIAVQTLQKISQEYGKISQATAFSIGTVVLSSALPQAKKQNIDLPLHLYFDRGPSSIESLGNKAGLFGKFHALLARYSGWDIDLGKMIAEHLSKRNNQCVVISSAEQDHHFENSLLSENPYIKNLSTKEGIYNLTFNFPRQLYTKPSHHTLHNGFLDEYHLTSKNVHLLAKGENMAQKIVRTLIKTPPAFDKTSLYLPFFSFFKLKQ